MILTLEQAREHIETSLGGDALQRLLDAAESSIVEVAGPNPTEDGRQREERHTPRGDLLLLSRVPVSIVSVTEGTTDLEVEADYVQRSGSGMLRRLSHAAWLAPVTVVYTTDDMPERVRVQIALVKLDLANSPGVTSERIGPWTEEKAASSAWNYESERASILASLSPGFEGIR